MKETILIISNVSYGLYLFRRDLIKRLIKEYNVEILAGDTGRVNDLQDLGCNISIIPFDRRGLNPVNEIKLLKNIFKKIRELHPALVITYTIKPNIYGGAIASILKIPYAANITGLGTGFQSIGIKKILIYMYRKALKNANVIFCENESIKDEFVKDGIAEYDKICVLHGAGVNLERFYYQEYPKDTNVFNFLFVGRVMREKGINEVIECIERLNKAGERCVLTILGSLEEDYSEMVKNNKNIRFMGWQNDIRPFIAETHCFVLPSYHEGMANTNLECAASGRPVITTNIPGCREAIINKVSGLLCMPKDVDSLYVAMNTIMQMSNEQRKNMGIFGREHMKRCFDKNNVIELTIERLFS